MFQPETLIDEYADQMLKQRPSIVIDCYDSDSKTEEENVVSADEKINDYCFYFDQTIEEDDGDECCSIDAISKAIIHKDKIVDLEASNSYNERAKTEEIVNFEDKYFEVKEDEISSNGESEIDDVQSIDSDNQSVLTESCLSVNKAIENIESESTSIKKIVKKSVRTTKTTSKKSSKIISAEESSVINSSNNESFDISIDSLEQPKNQQKIAINNFSTNQELSEVIQENNIDENQQQLENETNDMEKRKSNKKKTKKKKSDSEKENISVGCPDGEKKCHACEKVVFQMEQIKAEKKFWHRSCFRCVECSKQLNVDTYQSHEGILYCKQHFKTLFSPKIVEDNNEPIKVRKHEMIILENQPIELPPDVIRSSDKADLGLDELHQINLRQRFQLFENAGQQESKVELDKANNVKRSTSILSKLARFQAKGMDVGVVDDNLNGISYENSSTEEEDEDELDDENHEDIELIRAKRAQKEKPMSFKEMYDIKSKFESGQLMNKEERREERKQELQNIRSRLFMGKQAKIKEMYQQAVAESEQTITSSSKKSDVEIGDKAKSIMEMFEKGEIYDENDMKKTLKDDELAMFEKGISKQSRSLFLELDATASKLPNHESSSSANLKLIARHTPRQNSQTIATGEDIVRSDQKIDDVQIETADIVSKFKFFEAYQPPEKEKKSFRITPPRDYQGLTKLTSPEKEVYRDPHIARNEKRSTDQDEILELQKTASKVLSMFRQMEENKEEKPYGPKPLKRFTPPPEGERGRFVTNDDSGPDYSDEDDDDECSEEESEDESNYIKSSQKDLDEFLKAAQSAERAKKLREKFEKWEENEIKKEMNNSSINLYDEEKDEGQMETAKSLKARFEQMQNEEPKLPTNRPKVNRFV
ncbi:LIM domain and actin-binding protein 1 isoform X2 [Chironomus tepperi]|uniref:LIM domain and actin-binding protein 1 isoform X2 n=1 Tax=Chironomus tepperi TaxID=113505 RepID=UPI00391EE96D